MNTIEETTEEKASRTQQKGEGCEDAASSFPMPPSCFVSVRSYVADDYPHVLRLWETGGLRPYKAGEVERLLRSGGGALVAVQADAPEIPIGVILWSHNGNVGILWRLAVDVECRGQGIATKLLDRAENDICAAGLEGVTLLTRVTNTVARDMYARRGYKIRPELEFWGKRLYAPDRAETSTTERHGSAHGSEEGTPSHSQAAGESKAAGEHVSC